MKFKSKLLLAGEEATEDTAETLTGTDAVLTSDLTMNIYQGNKISRNFDTDALGASTEVNVNPHNVLSFGVEFAASGTAGTAPAYADLMLACGLASTNDAADHEFTPVSTGFKSATLQFLRLQDDGDHLFYTTTGVRGNMSLELAAGALPMYKFDNMMGSYVTPTQATAISGDTSDYIAPVAVTKDNTPTVTVGGTAACLSSFTMNLGNQISRRDAPNCRSTILGDRNVTGNIVIKAPDLSTKNYFTSLESHSSISTVAINIVHGTTAGNIHTVNLPYVQLTGMSEVDIDGDNGYDFTFVVTPSSSGNDEFSITLT